MSREIETVEAGDQIGAAVTVAAAGTTLVAQILTRHMEQMFCDISVITQALDAFQIHGRARGATSFRSMYSAAGDYTSPAGALIDASGDLTTIAAAGSGWFFMNVLGIDEIAIYVSAAVDGAVVTVKASGA